MVRRPRTLLRVSVALILAFLVPGGGGLLAGDDTPHGRTDGLVRKTPKKEKKKQEETPPPATRQSAPAVSETAPAATQRAPSGKWTWTMDGLGFLAYNRQEGRRAGQNFEAPHWMRLDGIIGAGRGAAGFRGRFSLEPATIALGGSPQIFQTGGTYESAPVVDRMHAQECVSMLEGFYRLPVGDGTQALRFSGAIVGPATLGPVFFRERRSASELAPAPLGHGWQDVTHVQSMVASVRYQMGIVAVEGSVFHGAEPDENRWDVDSGEPDSWAVRAWWDAPGPWSGQVSFGDLKDPQEAYPGDVQRTTASATYDRDLRRGFAAVTLAWGQNRRDEGTTQSWLLEMTMRYRRKNFVFGRLEAVEKYGLTREPGDDRVFRIWALTAGLERDFPIAPGWDTGLGGDITFHNPPSSLDSFYGSDPTCFRFFLRVRPSHPKVWGPARPREGPGPWDG